MSVEGWNVRIVRSAKLCVVAGLLGFSFTAAGQRAAPTPAQRPDAKVPSTLAPGTTELVNKPVLSCSVFFATDPNGANKITKPTIVVATESLKNVYVFYAFTNSGKGNAVNVPVEAIVGGSVDVPLAAKGGESSLANAYCPNESCKTPGHVTVNAGATIPAVKATSLTILPPSDVLSRPLFTKTNYAYVVLHAKAMADNKPCTDAQNYTIHYKK